MINKLLEKINLNLGKNSKNNKEIHSINPTTEKVISSVKDEGLEDLDNYILELEKTFIEWRAIPAPRRGELIRLIGEKLRKEKDFLGSIVSLEMGKSKQEGDGEVQEMIDMADFAVGQSRMMYGLSMHSERPQHAMKEQWHPLGIVGVISAYNFPVAVWSWNAFVAAICGNVVLWKPSPKTPLCSKYVQKICDEVCKKHNFPNIFKTIISSNVEVANKIVESEKISLVSFTGSTEIGREVAKKVSGRFGKFLLELGGNNAQIIDKSANLKNAIPAAVFGAVGTAGQRCTSLRRLLIHKDIYNDVKEKLINAYKQIKVGDPTNVNNLMGPLIDNNAVIGFENTIKEAIDNGGNLLVGGKKIQGKGFFVEPTIIEVNKDNPIIHKENFCPVLFILPYENLKDAIYINNNVNHGLSSSLFTNDISQMEEFLSYMGSDCGIANINIGTSGAEIGGAFGGEKHTGGGREAGSDSWKAYMRRQTNTINWGKDLPLAQGIKFNLD